MNDKNPSTRQSLDKVTQICDHVISEIEEYTKHKYICDDEVINTNNVAEFQAKWKIHSEVNVPYNVKYDPKYMNVDEPQTNDNVLSQEKVIGPHFITLPNEYFQVAIQQPMTKLKASSEGISIVFLLSFSHSYSYF